MKKITIQDVANELNISRNTVARALANSNTVAYETKYTVIKKAYEMGYAKLSPTILSEYKIRNKSDRTRTVVVLAKKELSTAWNRIMMGISEELNKNNCKLQFNFISEEDEANHILPIDTEMSGIIILSVFKKSYLELIINKEVPAVFLDGPSYVYDILDMGDVLLFEGKNSTKIVTEHLIHQGINKIGFMGDTSCCKSILERFEGYMTAHQLHGIKPDEQIVITKQVSRKHYKQEEIAAAFETLPYMPEAFVCANDDIAREVIIWMKKNGTRVPKDIAVTGFDDKEEIEYFSPSLTTVHIGNLRMGRRLVQRLLWRMNHMDFPHEIVIVNTEVIIRESSMKGI